MTAADRATAQSETAAQRRERERAERAEWDRLSARLSVLWPTYDCFCGTLDDLRRTVADLERQAARERPRRSADAVTTDRRQTASNARSRAWAGQHPEDDEPDESRREQLARWHTADCLERGAAHGDADAE